MFDSSPSIAAILIPFDLSGAVAFVASGMKGDGFRPTDRPLAKAQRAFPTECVSVAIAQIDAAGVSLVVTPSVAQIFELAVILSKGSPDVVLTAFRRFAGTEPVAKVVFGGKPQWKDGDDPDHEVFYDVPSGPSTELRLPSPIRVLTSAADILSSYEALITTLSHDPSGAESQSSWLHRRSRHGR